MKSKIAVIGVALWLLGGMVTGAAQGFHGEYLLATVQAADGKEAAPVFRAPSDNEPYARYNNGATVLVLEKEKGWCKIFHELFLYVREKDLQMTGESASGYEPLGFAVADFEPSAPRFNENGHTRALASCDVNSPGDDIANGDTVLLTGFAGDMLQIQRFHTDAFAYGEHFQVFLLCIRSSLTRAPTTLTIGYQPSLTMPRESERRQRCSTTKPSFTCNPESLSKSMNAR